MVYATVLSAYLAVCAVSLSGKTDQAEQWKYCPYIYIDRIEKDQNSMQIDRERERKNCRVYNDYNLRLLTA